jgi:uncharacterized protein DUF6941
MRAKLLLADSAEVREGLLFLLGAGWTDVGPGPQPFAIAGIIEVDWGETNASHPIEFALEDEDGNPLLIPTPAGDVPLRIGTTFEVGRPAGTRGGSFNVPLALPLSPVPWMPGRRYVLKVTIDGVEVDRLRFSVRAAPESRAPSPPGPTASPPR